MKKVILVLLYLFVFNGSAIALVEVDITRGNLNPLPIAVSPFDIGPGSKELIFLTQLVLEGDLILPIPSWVSYEPQAKIVNNSKIGR